jgi:HlyD family secretion protein
MKRTTRIALRLGIVLILTGGAISGLFLWRSAAQSATPGSGFQTAAVTRGTLERTVSSTGTLAAVETVAVGTEVSGTIEKVLADFNDQVKKGQVLAVLKQDLFAAAVTESRGAVSQAEASLALAEREYQRNLPLYQKGYLSEQEFLPLQINADKARAALESARAGLARVGTNLQNSVIRSPIDGTVIQRSIDAGQTVAASLNTPTLFVIARDLARMQIEADVDETDIGQIRQGQTVRFSVQTWPERVFDGTVLQVRLQPEVVSNVVTYTVIVDAPNMEGLLLPGMTATVDFIIERVEDALLVPNAALRFQPSQAAEGEADHRPANATVDSGKSRVFRLAGDGRLQRVPVTAGISDGQLTVVSGAGVEAGMEVVTGLGQSEEKRSKNSFSLLGAMRGGPPR